MSMAQRSRNVLRNLSCNIGGRIVRFDAHDVKADDEADDDANEENE